MSVLFAVALVVVGFFYPGFKVGEIPFPAEYAVAAGYVAFFNPQIPRRYMAIFSVAFGYLCIVSARNAAGDGGSIRDFLYVFLFIGQLLVFSSLRSLFDRGYGKLVINLMIGCAFLNLAIMFAQMLDLFSIDEQFSGLWTQPLKILAREADSLVHADEVQGRPYGLMPGFDMAALGLYLAFRAAYVYTGRWIFRLLGLVAILSATARLLAVFFILYEAVIPVLFQRRSRAAAFSFVTIAGCVFFVGIVSIVNPRYFLVSFLSGLTSGDLASNDSITNRLDSLQWALGHWGQMLTFGGIHSNEFLSLSRSVDSEIILRSLQFGLTGFFLLVLMIYFYFHKYRSYDTYFLLLIMLWASLTNSAASNFVLCPFLLLYGFACRAAFLRKNQSANALHDAGDAPIPSIA